jgi:hypothetical protein
MIIQQRANITFDGCALIGTIVFFAWNNNGSRDGAVQIRAQILALPADELDLNSGRFRKIHSSEQTSKISVALAGILGGLPLSPYA